MVRSTYSGIGSRWCSLCGTLALLLSLVVLVASASLARAQEVNWPDGPAGLDIASGRVFDWLEFSTVFRFDDHTTVTSDIEIVWSISSFDPPRAFFYVTEYPLAEVALAPGVEHVSDMRDASLLTYETSDAAGPLIVGEFVFFRNQTTGFFGAMRFDGAYDPGGGQGLADVTWFLQQDGSADFGAFVFSDDFESGDISFWTDPAP